MDLKEENIRLKDALDREVQENMILKDKIEGLQDRIDKAIEYLKENACYENIISELFCDDLDSDSCMELLDILKGE